MNRVPRALKCGSPSAFAARHSAAPARRRLPLSERSKAAEDRRTPRRCRAVFRAYPVHGPDLHPILEVFPLHEPSGAAGFGVRQSSAALTPKPRQRCAWI